MLFASYVWRSLLARIRANAFTMLAVCLFVIGGSLGLSFYLSLQSMLVDTAPKENLIVLAKGAPSEQGSKLQLESARKVVLLPGIKRVGETPLAARELVTRVHLATGTTYENAATIRGYDEQSPTIHRITMVKGSLPAPGSLEMMFGRRVAEEYSNLAIGAEINLPGGVCKVSGIFSAEGGPLEDEVWTARAALELHVNTKFSSSVTLVAETADQVPALVDKINASKDIDAQAASVASFRAQTANLDGIARTVVILLLLLSVVAASAIATTMNAATLTRMPELAALAAIGIRRSFLARVVLLESVALAAIGAIFGVGIAALIRSQLGAVSLGADAVAVSSTVVVPITGIALGIVVGIIGGIMPSLAVRRLDIIQSLR